VAKKGNANKVNGEIARLAVERAQSKQSVYSQCIVLAFKTTGRMAPGFDNVDLQAWIDQNCAGVFDAKGRKTCA